MAAVNLFELLNGKVFRIPDYQRGYAWIDKQLTELWDDIEEIPEVNGEFRKHYTGTIYLEEISAIENEKWLSGVKFYDVVDGQQRLTTISIFLFELLKSSEFGFCDETKEDLMKTYIRKSNSSGNSTVYKFSYANTDKNYLYLLKIIFEDNSIILPQNPYNQYTKNLLLAKNFFNTKFRDLDYNQKEIIFRKMTSSIQFDIRTIEKDLDVQAVFETMNNRGKPLSTLEKLKNRLIYLTEKLNESPEDKLKLRKNINDAWGKIYGCLGQNPDLTLDEDIFLSAHLSLYRKPKEAFVFSEKLAEEKIFQMFCNKSDKFEKEEGSGKEELVNYNKIEDYIIKLSDAAPIWYKIHNSYLEIIKKILLLNNSKEMKVFLLSLLDKLDTENLIPSILEKTESILFRNKVPGIGVVDERVFATWGRDLYREEEGLNDINEKLNEIIQIPIPVHNLINSFNYLFNFERGNKGFYRWWYLKYFLFEYDLYLKNAFSETNNKIEIEDYDSTTIEHIIPQQYWDNWNEVVGEFSNSIIDENKSLGIKILINTLGNLTILKNGKNSSLGNRSWENKKRRFKTGSYNEIAVSHYDNWTKKEVMDRGLKMLDFLSKKVSGLNLTKEEKHKILFYQDFAINSVIELIHSPANSEILIITNEKLE